MKKIISVIIVILILLFVASSLIVKAENEYMKIHMEYSEGWSGGVDTKDALTYHYEGETIVVDGCIDALYNFKEIRRMYIPSEYEGHPVRFAEGAFKSLPAKKLIFKEGVSHIPENLCYQNEILEEVEFPESLKKIGKSAFEGCVNLSYTNTINAEIIGEKAFYGCEKLNSKLGDNVKNVKKSSFEKCFFVDGLDYFFKQESEFVDGAIVYEGITYELHGDELWLEDAAERRGEIIIPEEIKGYSVKVIGYPGFYDNDNITRVVVPKSARSVDWYCFFSCDNLKEVVLNEGLDFIGVGAFKDCKSLEKLIIPDTVKKISEEAFRGSGITEIKIGCGVESIGSGAFWNCNKLKELTLPDSVKILGYPPQKKTNGYFGGTKTFEYPSPFYYMSGLKTITIGKGVEEIYTNTFSSCSNLENIIVSPENLNYASFDGVLYTKDMKKMVLYPQGKMTREFAVPQGVEEIGDKAMQKSFLIKMYVPESLVSFGEGNTMPYTIEVYKAIETVPDVVLKPYDEKGEYNNISWEIKDGVLKLYGYGWLTTTINGAQTPIPWKVEDVKEVIIGEGISSIYGVFKNHINLKKVTFPETLTRIDKESFRNCQSLEKVVIPKRVSYIGEMAFAECYNLKEVSVLTEVDTKIFKAAFDIADGATVYLSDCVVWMDEFAFTHIKYNEIYVGQFSTNKYSQDVTIVATYGSYADSWAMKNSVRFRGNAEAEDDNAYVENGAVYIGAKEAFEALGISVFCDDRGRIAVCSKGTEWMIFSHNKETVTTKSGIITMKNSAKWIDGMFMIAKEDISLFVK